MSSQEERIQQFSDLLRSNIKQHEADMTAYHNMYGPLDCYRKRILVGAQNCVCFSSSGPTATTKKKSKSKKNKKTVKL